MTTRPSELINKDDDGGHDYRLVFLDLLINIGINFLYRIPTGDISIFLSSTTWSIPRFQISSKIFVLPNCNVSIPIVVKWFADQLSKKIIKLK